MNTKTYMQAESFVDTDPCFGCISLSCRFCPCFDGWESDPYACCVPAGSGKPRTELPGRRVSRKRKDAIAAPEKTKVRETAVTPKGIFGTVGEGLVLQADGDGMCNAGIHIGDWLIFDTERILQDGDIAIIGFDNGKETVACRRLLFEDGRKRIRREDGETADIIVDECRVYAVMVGIMHGCGTYAGA